jgi:phospholipid/cholesterol/gamma-HCH transport system substrate-binding protein
MTCLVQQNLKWQSILKNIILINSNKEELTIKAHSTHYIHRISYSFQEKIVGVFVLSAVCVLIALLFSTIKSQNIFEEHFVIYGTLSSAEGLSKETIVQISGIEVGKVADIDITEENEIMLTMHIYKRYHRLLREDSKIKVSGLNAAIIGKSIIVITAGSYEKPLIGEGAMLQVQESHSIDDVIAKAKAILEVINNMIKNMSLTVEAIDPDDIKQTITSFKEMAVNIEKITRQVESGQGPVGAVLYDEKIVSHLQDGVLNMKQTTEELKNIAKTLSGDIKQVPEVIKNIDSVIRQTEQTIQTTQKTIQATQRIWPISSAMPAKDASKKIISPMPAND